MADLRNVRPTRNIDDRRETSGYNRSAKNQNQESENMQRADRYRARYNQSGAYGDAARVVDSFNRRNTVPLGSPDPYERNYR